VHESDHQPGTEDALTDGVRVSMSQQHMVPLSCYPLASDLIGLRVCRTPAYARISTESEDRRCTLYEAYPAGRNVASCNTPSMVLDEVNPMLDRSLDP
jgi:hypothetical protein